MRAIPGVVPAITLASFALGQSAPAPKFDVTDARASVRATNPYTYTSGGMLRAGRYDLRKATMLDLIRFAYGVDADRVLGGPSWLELDRFDVSGKAPPSTPPEAVKLMLQALLADPLYTGADLTHHKRRKALPVKLPQRRLRGTTLR